MFIYLSKKIAIPNNTKLNCLAWNKEDGYIAVGGENGLLKVLKLDAGGESDANSSRFRGLAATSNLSMNQTLEGHTENIQVITWNESHKKLTTSDQNGVIIVWMIYKNAWYEEMINNRKKSIVVGMSWSSDGQKICIIYEDGAVIVGSVDGNRIWGKELKGVLLSAVQWSPDGKFLLFALKNGEVHLYDNQGNYTMLLDVHCLQDSNELASIVGLDWYDGKQGYIYPNCSSLAICYENGRLQLMVDESDPNPVIIDTSMNAVHCRWNHNGSVLSVTGFQHEKDKIINMVQFYTPNGDHIRTLKIPGKSISCCEWEAGSLRVALAVDSFVYFANIRPDYKWCYFKKTVVFMSPKPQKSGVSVSFWDIANNQCHTRYLPSLMSLAGYGDYCVLAIKSEIDDESAGKYGLLLCNTLGIPIDGKYTDIEPLWVTMNSYYVIIASKDYFLLWQYSTPKNSSGTYKGRCQFYHIDDNPSGAIEVIKDFEDTIEEQLTQQSTVNPICCVASTDKCLLIGRESGLIHHYVLPHLALINKYKIDSRPHKLAINCNSTRCTIIDVAGVLTMMELSESIGFTSNTSSEVSKLERKDVWAMCWASDNPQLLAIMEKTRMYVFKGIYPEEPMASSGYICCFQDLEIQAILLDDVMDSSDRPSKNHIIRLEVKSLRDTKQLLEKVGINEAVQFIEDNPHPRLWRLLGEAAVNQMNFIMAESAFIRSLDYPGIQFIKKLQGISKEDLKKAVIAAYFKKYDDAEKIFLESDRRDLALNLRRTLGDWFRVVQVMKMSIQGNDIQFESAWNAIGYYFYHRQNWEGAKEYFEKSRNIEMLINCYYILEDYDALEASIGLLSDQHPLLNKIAKMFVSVGRCSAAVAAYLKYGDICSTVNLCIKQNEWTQAISLAKQGNLPQISDLLVQYARYLISKNCLGEAVELFHKANKHIEAVKIIHELIKMEVKKRSNPLKIKKLYVYAALLIEEHLRLTKFDQSGGLEVVSDLDLIKSAWRGAEAYHLLFLVHNYIFNGKEHDALVTLIKLKDYEDILPAEEIYCLLAITACIDNCFAICSTAFMKLESLEEVSENSRQTYADLAVSILIKHGTDDFYINRVECINCDSLIPDWSSTCSVCFTDFQTCMVKGKPLIDDVRIWTCTVCRHCCSESSITLFKNCPLCHTLINNN